MWRTDRDEENATFCSFLDLFLLMMDGCQCGCCCTNLGCVRIDAKYGCRPDRTSVASPCSGKYRFIFPTAAMASRCCSLGDSLVGKFKRVTRQLSN